MGLVNKGHQESREQPEAHEQRETEELQEKWSSTAFILSGGIVLLLMALKLLNLPRGGSLPAWVTDLLVKVGVLAAVGGLFLHLRRMASRASRLARTAGARRSLR